MEADYSLGLFGPQQFAGYVISHHVVTWKQRTGQPDFWKRYPGLFPSQNHPDSGSLPASRFSSGLHPQWQPDLYLEGSFVCCQPAQTVQCKQQPHTTPILRLLWPKGRASLKREKTLSPDPFLATNTFATGDILLLILRGFMGRNHPCIFQVKRMKFLHARVRYVLGLLRQSNHVAWVPFIAFLQHFKTHAIRT